MPGIWLYRLISKSRYQSSSLNFVLLLLIGLYATKSVSAIEGESGETIRTETRNNFNANNEISQTKNIPANHRIDDFEEIEKATLKIIQQQPNSSRNSRQYDAPISSSSSGNYAAISGDSGAYVAQMPLTGTNYGQGSGAGSGSSYAHDLSGAYHPNMYHDPMSLARGYSAPISPIHHAAAAGYSPPFGGGPISSIFSAGPLGNAAGGGLLSNSMFPLMSKGFDLSEIVCTAVAVAIGAVIIGAPFILIYLFVMNQMNNNGSNMGPNGGSISLTGPTSSTNVSGRKKRQISFPEALFKQLSPLVNNEQVANTFKALMSSIAKYQM